jgi:hypothetical protein
MKQPSKATARVQSITDPRLEKPLLHLHAAIDVDSFWQAVQDVIGVALQTRFIGLTLQHSPISPRIARSTAKLPGSFFPIAPVEKYFNTHPRRNVIFISVFFSTSAISGGLRFTAVAWYRQMADVPSAYSSGVLDVCSLHSSWCAAQSKARCQRAK